MPGRLGRQIPHSDNVDCENIRACFSQCGEYRYLLTIPYRGECGRLEVVSVILKNPSSADEHRADRSVRRVEDYVYRKFPQCGELRILNLFAYRATYPRCLRSRIDQRSFNNAVGSENDPIIRSSLCSSNHIIVAWGRPGPIAAACYDFRIEQVERFLQPFREKLRQVENLCYPKHAQVWSYEDALYPYQIQQAEP